jgi:hypothetical protein
MRSKKRDNFTKLNGVMITDLKKPRLSQSKLFTLFCGKEYTQ